MKIKFYGLMMFFGVLLAAADGGTLLQFCISKVIAVLMVYVAHKQLSKCNI